MQVWHRSLARIRRMRSADAPPEAPTTRSSPAMGFPLEIVEMIIVHLIYDIRSLLACSLTCSSWYIAAVAHLHHTLTIHTHPYPWVPREKMWPRLLVHLHKLGLLPLVKKLRARCESYYGVREGCFPETFHRDTLHQLSSLANLQELVIDYLNISEFIPSLQQHSGHFLPTLRSLVLQEPKCSRRQIIYFLGLFQHLEDLTLLFAPVPPSDFQGESTDEPTLTPFFTPPLRGRLTMRDSGVELVKDMISLFGGLRFRYMDIIEVDGAWLLLDACAGTLETLRLYHKCA